mmetsp:Transcript_18041/g.37446  ORF Transcript_18041/g.37446 Transcript_18041/m.37446 type:complete len:97 (+) Transcript_18041:950-1240(+)
MRGERRVHQGSGRTSPIRRVVRRIDCKLLIQGRKRTRGCRRAGSTPEDEEAVAGMEERPARFRMGRRDWGRSRLQPLVPWCHYCVESSGLSSHIAS